MGVADFLWMYNMLWPTLARALAGMECETSEMRIKIRLSKGRRPGRGVSRGGDEGDGASAEVARARLSCAAETAAAFAAAGSYPRKDGGFVFHFSCGASSGDVIFRSSCP